MIVHYLDSSAWVKNYYEETGSQWVQELFAQDTDLSGSSLGLIEVTATLSRKLKSREINRAFFTEKTQRLAADWNRFLRLQLTEDLVDRSRDVARDHALRGADAIHLASALKLNQRFSSIDQLVLVTADQELAAAAQASRLTVANPDDKDAATPHQP